jgi:hypothetical protein
MAGLDSGCADDRRMADAPALRRSHYELAFEALLNRRGTPFVSVEDVRRRVPGRTGIKCFDYVVYSPAGPACLVDVKGRKAVRMRDGSWRLKNWVTRADLDGLAEWLGVFGDGFDAAFVFAYWLEAAADNRNDDSDEKFILAGRLYEFRVIRLADYQGQERCISRRWETVAIPDLVFRSVSRPLEQYWVSAPC